MFLTGLSSIPAELEAMLTAARTFFDQPELQKSASRWSGTGQWQGWQPLYSGRSGAAPMERFEVALPDPADFPTDDEWLATFALWPPPTCASTTTWRRTGRRQTGRSDCARTPTSGASPAAGENTAGGLHAQPGHQVVNPPRTAGYIQRERYSVVFFHHPDLDSWVAPTRSAAGAVNAREHVLGRQRKAYQA